MDTALSAVPPVDYSKVLQSGRNLPEVMKTNLQVQPGLSENLWTTRARGIRIKN
jgi:hypothetical protein